MAFFPTDPPPPRTLTPHDLAQHVVAIRDAPEDSLDLLLFGLLAKAWPTTTAQRC